MHFREARAVVTMFVLYPPHLYPFPWVAYNMSQLVRNGHLQGPQCLRGLVKYQLCHEQRQKPSADTQDRRSAWTRNLRGFVHVG